MFNGTFKNISVISWRTVLLVEEAECPGKTIELPRVTDKQYHIILYRLLHLAINEVRTHNLSVVSCKDFKPLYIYHDILITLHHVVKK